MCACVSRIILTSTSRSRTAATQLIGLVARIDDGRLARPLAADDEAVLVEGSNGTDFEDHAGYNPINMIVCVVDDLIFSIKISTAAKQLGVEMYFERSKDRCSRPCARSSRRSSSSISTARSWRRST